MESEDPSNFYYGNLNLTLDKNNSIPYSETAQSDSTPTVGSDEVPIKKKRKQLVACDACRVRRVKCDKADQRGGSCTECIKKAINCTDTYIRSKPRVVRNGKLIEKARLLYGDGNVNGSPESSAIDDLRRPSSSSSGNQGQMIRATDGRLLVGFLAHAIAADLIDTYIEIIHPQCPIIDIVHFKKNFEAAGRDTSKMSPSGESLALVLQALAARFSDHSSIIGTSAPKIQDLRVSPGRDFSDYGVAREPFARSMAERALKAVDENGTLRRPSAASAGALLMLEFLLTWDDSHRSIGRHLVTAAVEHLRSLSDGVTDDPTEDKVDQVGTLFWMCYTRDSISSAFGGRSTSLSNDDLEVLCELLSNPMTDQIMTFVSSDDPRNLCGLAVICSFKLITEAFRKFTAQVAGPLPRRSPLNEIIVRELWSVIAASRKYSSIYYDSVQRATWSAPPKSDPWFRDLTSMRVQLSFVIHRNICDRLDAELTANRPRDLAYQNYVDVLRALKSESDTRFLLSIRDLGLYMHNYGTNLIFCSALSCENMPLYLDHMLSIPVWEQGGNEDWTLENKLEEVNWFLNALKQMSWAWNYKRAINDGTSALVHLNLQAQHAIPSSTRSYTQSPPPATYGILPHPSSSQSTQFQSVSHLDPAALHETSIPPIRSVPGFRAGSSSSSSFNPILPNTSSSFDTSGTLFHSSQIVTDHDGFAQPYPDQILPPLSYAYEDFTSRHSTSNYSNPNQYLYTNPDTFTLPPSVTVPTSSSIPQQYPLQPIPDTSGTQYSYDPTKYPSFDSNQSNPAYRRGN